MVQAHHSQRVFSTLARSGQTLKAHMAKGFPVRFCGESFPRSSCRLGQRRESEFPKTAAVDRSADVGRGFERLDVVIDRPYGRL